MGKCMSLNSRKIPISNAINSLPLKIVFHNFKLCQIKKTTNTSIGINAGINEKDKAEDKAEDKGD
jgi:hypothetical protein